MIYSRRFNELLNNPKDALKAVQLLVNEKNELTKALEEVNQEKSKEQKGKLLESVEAVNGYNILVSETTLPDGDALKKLSFELKNEIEDLIMILAANIGGKPQISVMISESLVNSLDLNAGNIVRELAKEIKGGGGGQPFFATAGGKELEGLPKVITKAQELVRSITNH